jgi:endonuclease YncB( thermonuclease family)
MLAVLLLPASARADSAPQTAMHAKVIAYSSGTAFAVLDADEQLKRVKLTGVDAPERRQRFAEQAKQLASEWLGAQPIDVVIDTTDKDQRVHGRVSVDGRDVGLTLIEAGLAWCDPHDEASLPGGVREAYRKGCDHARAQRRGLWQDANPTPPWDNRKVPQFDPAPGSASAAPRSCREIGYQTLQCDDGTAYRGVGSQVVGSDGTVYTRRGNTVTGSDGNRYEQQGTRVYGSDGSVCRSRGRRVDCY